MTGLPNELMGKSISRKGAKPAKKTIYKYIMWTSHMIAIVGKQRCAPTRPGLAKGVSLQETRRRHVDAIRYGIIEGDS